MRRLCSVLFLLMLVTLYLPLRAQTVDTAIEGTVTDNSGAVNQIPVDPVAQQMAKNYMPQANTSQNGLNYAYVTGGNLSVNQYLLRLDHKITDADQLAFHFMYAFRNSPSVDPNPNFTYNSTFPIFNLGLQYVHTFSPSLINELRLGYDYEHQKLVTTLAGTNFTPASIGINGFVQPSGAPWPPPETGFPIVSSNDLIGLGENSGIGIDNSVTYQLVQWSGAVPSQGCGDGRQESWRPCLPKRTPREALLRLRFRRATWD